MSDDRYIPGVPCWIDLTAPDPDGATAFYAALFGWTYEDALPAGSPQRYAIAHRPGGTVGAIAGPAEDGVHPAWEMYVRVAGADVVNEHGSVNFNQLHTRDVEGAKAFYGAVFGWELLGVGEAQMWALPGYGDFLEQRRPGMREQMAAMGAPERFEDVVASVLRP